MGRIGVYLERYNISSGGEMNALMRFAQVARKYNHRVDFLFRPDIFRIPEYDAIYIRALTDPLNAAYAAARTAEMHGVRVIDDPDSIRICCDKVSMYQHLIRAGVVIPETRFVQEQELTREHGARLLEELGRPMVLKAPHSSFSLYVEKAETPAEFITIGKRFFRRADRIVAQKFIRSVFDWRIGVLGGEPLYACKYGIPSRRWKILTYTPEGHTVRGSIKAAPLAEIPPLLMQRAVEAANAVGQGLYGVDLKQVNGDFVVIEVNDNPTIYAGEEDHKAPDLYDRLVRYLIPGNPS